MWYRVVPRINKHVLNQKLFRWERERHEITTLAGMTPNIKTRKGYAAGQCHVLLPQDPVKYGLADTLACFPAQ